VITRKVLLPLIAVALIFSIIGCSNSDEELLLKVDDYSLTVGEFRQNAIQRYQGLEMAQSQSIETLEEYLDFLLIKQLRIIDGKNKGFDNDPEVIRLYDEALKQSAITKLYREYILKRIILEKDLREFYERDSYDMRASHILLEVNEETTDDQIVEQLNQIRQIALSGDQSFEELAEKYNQDLTTPEGDLGWFRWGKFVEPFQEAVFKLKPGEISEPVQTSYGWHIIMLKEKKKRTDMLSYSESKDNILDHLSRYKRLELYEAAREFIAEEEAKQGVVYHDETISSIYKSLEGRLQTRDPFSLLTEEQRSLPLVSLGSTNKDFTAPELAEYYERLMASGGKIDSDSTLHKLIESFMAEKIILPSAARDAGFFEDKDALRTAERKAGDRIAQLAYGKIVSENVNPTDEQALEYYTENGEKYFSETQYTLVEALVEEKGLAESIAKQAKEGKSLRELSAKHSKRVDAKAKNGVFGPIRRGQYGVLGRMAAEAEFGEVVGPVRHGKMWSVFKVISSEEPRMKDFEEVKYRVLSDLRADIREQLEIAWDDSLKEAVDYSIYPQRLKNVFPDQNK